jgi:ABC-type thiamin/hydroxymethylpyrimidine transport system permease subunit
MVNYVGFKLSKQVNGNKSIPFIGFVLCMTATIVLIVQQYNSNRIGVLIAMGILLFCFLIEYFYKKTEPEKATSATLKQQQQQQQQQ